MSEKLCLKWNDFQDNINTAFGSLRNDNDFTDVTLACEDGQQVEAHKVILAASSPFFQNLLKINKHPHPLVYMKGVKSEDLVAIIDFLYYGEANVYQENIDAFLAIAEELKLKGLSGPKNGEQIEDVVPSHTERKTKIPKKNVKTDVTAHALESSFENHENTERSVVPTNQEVSHVSITNVQDLDEQVNSMISRSQNKVNGQQSRLAFTCTVCGKEGQNGSIKDHIEANHLEGVSIPCTSCEKTFRSRNALRQHIRLHK